MLIQNCSQLGGHLVPERKDRRTERQSHYSIQHLSSPQTQTRNSDWVHSIPVLLLGCLFFPLDFLLTFLWPKSIQSGSLNKHSAEKQDTVLSANFFWGSYSQKIYSSYFCDLKVYEGEAVWERVNPDYAALHSLCQPSWHLGFIQLLC